VALKAGPPTLTGDRLCSKLSHNHSLQLPELVKGQAMHGLHWFRTDLRTVDNTALEAAMRRCDKVFAIYIITPKTWLEHDAAACKIQFILNNLACLSKKCQAIGIPLLIRRCDYFSECPLLLKKLCDELKINCLFFNKQYELDEARRDQRVIEALAPTIKIEDFDDELMMPPGTVLSQQQKPLQIFTPFKKVWLQKVSENDGWKPISSKKRSFQLSINPDPVPDKLDEFHCTINLDQWPAGEEAAQKRLEQFCAEKITHYHEQRDIPSRAGTSQLSPYLAQGVISASQCVQAILQSLSIQKFQEIQNYPGPATWLSELIWREFYKHIVFFYPEICRHKPFKSATDKIPWRYSEHDFQRWCAGKTGFPLVDAAMRQLNQTGWMHNRLRMVVAMFLSKTLFLDWRLGEKYFMQHLIDGDFSANNGGWQWSASTGTDAVPYFRIFNPIRQSERFDPEGHFIRQYCPELSELDHQSIHNPHESKNSVISDYPKPIVDYNTMRQMVIAEFKKKR
jgi:deoxyribodipyrimidine photo-lyase